GVLLSSWSVEALRRLLPSTLPRLEHVSIDAQVLLFATAVSVITGILFGFLPALRLSRVEPLSSTREGGRGATTRLSPQSSLVIQIQGGHADQGAEPSEQLSVATPGFFHTMGIPLIAGRDFTPSDNTKAPAVAIVNEAFARRYFPDESPLGKRFKPGLGDGT